MHRSSLIAGLAFLVSVPAAALVISAQPQERPPTPPAPAPAPATPPQADDAMAVMMEMATPGEEHALLRQFEGRWKAQTKAWFGPEPSESTGSMVNTLVLDGRFLRHEFSGDMMGMPFQGLGYWGYDKARKEWIGNWMDTWSTGMMVSGRGTYSADTKTWTMYGTYFNPETQQEETQREVIRVIDNDTHRMEMFMVGPDGQEMKTLEITYTRQPRTPPGQEKKEDRPTPPGRR